jgi:hypothetical protein
MTKKSTTIEQHEGDEQKINRDLERLKFVDFFRTVALPVATGAAGLGFASSAAVFPAVVGFTALVVGAGELFVQREKGQLRRRIELLKERKDVDAATVRQMESTL